MVLNKEPASKGGQWSQKECQRAERTVKKVVQETQVGETVDFYSGRAGKSYSGARTFSCRKWRVVEGVSRSILTDSE